ncbi:hypothetical protein ABFS82_14G072800 [Erythranthe guttata]
MIVAKAQYSRATEEEKGAAKKFFQSLDGDCDGKVNLAEYKSLVLRAYTHESLFNCLDENSDGSLDFEEVLVLHYMQKCGMRICDGSCHGWLLGPYFSCTICEKNYPKTYDLCCTCYSGGKFKHDHPTTSFLDDRSMRMLLAKTMSTAQLGLPNDEVEFYNARNAWDAE